MDSEEEVTSLPTIGRRAIQTKEVPEILTSDNVSPSTMDSKGDHAEKSAVEVFQYGDELQPEVSLTGAELGTFLHQCFEVLADNPELFNKLAAVTGVDIAKDTAKDIARGVSDFEKWLHEYFSVETILRELPLLALDDNGSVMSGIADLVVKTKDGVWIIDHKSDQVDDVELA